MLGSSSGLDRGRLDFRIFFEPLSDLVRELPSVRWVFENLFDAEMLLVHQARHHQAGTKIREAWRLVRIVQNRPHSVVHADAAASSDVIAVTFIHPNGIPAQTQIRKSAEIFGTADMRDLMSDRAAQR